MDIDKVMSLLTLILKNTVRFYEKSNSIPTLIFTRHNDSMELFAYEIFEIDKQDIEKSDRVLKIIIHLSG